MKGDQVATAIREYHSLFDASESGDLAARKKHYGDGFLRIRLGRFISFRAAQEG